jgi:hypothetical protein
MEAPGIFGMAVYVVLLFDLDDAVVVSADTIEAPNRDEARAKARELLHGNPDAEGYEIWYDGAKLESWFTGDDGGARN